MIADKTVTTGRPIPWPRHKFVPVPSHLRETIDPSERVQLHVLCAHCKEVAVKIDRNDDDARPGATQTDPQGLDILQTAKAGCHLCTHVINKIPNLGRYSSISYKDWMHSEECDHNPLVHQSWSYFSYPDHGKLTIVLNARVQEDFASPDSRNESDVKEELTITLRVDHRNAAEVPGPPHLSVFTMTNSHINLAKAWAHECLKDHSECPKNKVTWMPTRLIEITAQTRVHLINTNSLDAPVPYYALSYCWGKSPVLTTTLSTVDAFENNIPFEQLPLTIQDTITVVDHMGGKYLWVDSLCIIQDFPSDWITEAASMCDVYQNAYLTIVALGAAGATEGLFGRRDALATSDCSLGGKTIPAPEVLAQNYTLFPTSTLQSRGWAFQERALAPRKLFFSSYLFWECADGLKEERPNPVWKDSAISAHNHEMLMPLSAAKAVVGTDRMKEEEGRVPEWLAAWYTRLVDYTERDLTEAKDRLVAITGVIKYCERWVGQKSYFGMWTDYWKIDLLWKSNGFREKVKRLEGVPTWSWASLTAKVAPMFDVGKEMLFVKATSIEISRKDESVLVIEGRLLHMVHEDSSAPQPKRSEREHRMRMVVGAGREKRLRAIAEDSIRHPSVDGHWKVLDMKFVDCVVTLDRELDEEGLAVVLPDGPYPMLPLVLQAHPLAQKEAPLIRVFGIAIHEKSNIERCYKRFGTAELVLDMGARRRDRIRRWKGKIEEPDWPRDSWQTIYLS